MKNIAIFVSGNGTNCENIIKHFAGSRDVRVALVVSNRADSYALTRAARHNIPTVVIPKSEFGNEAVLMDTLQRHDICFIVLAGFLLMIPDFLVKAYDHRMVNIHPALLPKYGGKGMYGDRVHEAVIAAGEKESGITIHYTNEHYDEGAIICQVKCPVLPEDTPDDLAQRIHALEYDTYPKVIEKLLESEG
mgnify:CR=1 FL=1